MDLSTEYLGLRLPHPFVSAACPLADRIEGVRRLEDAGAAAITLRSLFEEQLSAESIATHRATSEHADSFGEARSYLPDPDDFVLGPQEYLEHIRRCKEAVRVPVMASLNGCTPGGWLAHARLIEQAGADALELNVYDVPLDPSLSSERIESDTVQMASAVCRAVRIPVAVKLSPFYTSIPHFARSLDGAGVSGLVLFNRFYEPDIDVELLEVRSHLELSTPEELRLRLRWLAILHGSVRSSLAVSGGVHDPIDAVKALMCGASVVQMASALLTHGVELLAHMRRELAAWLEEKEYSGLKQMIGCMSLPRCPRPGDYGRANYIHMLHTWDAV